MQAIPSLLLLLLMIVLLCMTGVGETAATLGVIIISTLLIGSLGPTGFAYRLLTMPVMAYLGRISYSLYLWHWSVICLSRWTIGLSWWLAPALLVVTLALATASYHLIEAKLRHAPWSDKRWKSLVIGLSSLAGLAFVMVVLLGPGHKALYLGSPPPSDEQANANRATGGNRGTVLMIGDSHAGEFGVLVSNLARQFDMRPQVVSFGATAYPTVRISTPVGGLTLARSQLMSAQADAQVDRALTGMNPNGKNLIILSSFYSFYFGSLPGIRSHQVMTHYDASHRLISREKALDAWLGNLRAFAIHHSNQPIVIFLSTPQMPNIYSQNICRKEWFRPNPSANCRITVDRQRTVALLAELNARIAGAVADLPGVSLFDPLPALCPAQDRVCRSDDGDIRLFSDEDHLTLAGVEKVQAAFAHFLLEHKLLL